MDYDFSIRGDSERMLEKYCEKFNCLWFHASPRKRILIGLLIYTILFAITFLTAYSAFFIEGKSFIWTSDGRTQHYPALVYIGRYLRALILSFLQGNGAISLFDYNIGAGSDILTSLNYYGFGDPLNLFAVFVPTRYIEYLYNALIVLRIYLAGITFIAFCIYHGHRVSFSLLGAFIYAFSGFCIFSSVRHPFFLNPMIQLPLLLIGIDLVLRKKKTYIFIGSVVYSALCGFYFLYMMTIMIGIYALVKFFDYYKVERIKEFINVTSRGIGNYLLGLGISAALFLPVVLGYLDCSRSGGGLGAGKGLLFYDWNYYRDAFFKGIAPPGSWNSLSLAAIAGIAVILLFFNRKSEYRCLKIWLVISVAFFVFPLGGSIFNGFSYPSNRWTFGVALLLAYMTVKLLPELLNLNRKQQVLCLCGVIVYAALVVIYAKNRTVYYVVGVAELAITIALLIFLASQDSAQNHVKRARKEKQNNECIKIEKIFLCLLLIIANVSINATYRFAKDQANYVKEFTTYGTETARLENAIEREAGPYLKKHDGRVDSSLINRNLGMVWRIPVMTFYWSVSSKDILSFWREIENSGNVSSFALYRTDNMTMATTLLSNKYYLEQVDREVYVPFGYNLLDETEKSSKIYENQYSLPWGYSYDVCISYEDLKSLNGLEKQEMMLQAIALDNMAEDVDNNKIETSSYKLPYDIDKMTNVEWKDGVLNVKKDNGTITLSYNMPAMVEGHLRLKGLDLNGSGVNEINLKINSHNYNNTARVHSPDNNYYFGKENYLLNLGYGEQERTTCTITFPKKGVFKLKDIEVLVQPMDKYPEQVEKLKEEPLENIKMETNRITGTISLSKDKILCLSVPYSKGWTAKVDGEPVEILKGNYMFMAVPLEAGYHEIEFNYCTPGLRLGVACTIVSLLILSIKIWRDRLKVLKAGDEH